jgi:hypothetical protein
MRTPRNIARCRVTASAHNFQKAQPKRADMLAHLSALFPPDFVHPYPDAQIEIAYGVPGSLDRAELFSAFRLEAAADFAVAKNSRGCNVYVGPTLKKGSAAQSARTRDADFLAGICGLTMTRRETSNAQRA